MWTFYSVQENDNDSKKLIASTLHISLQFPGNRYVCVCDDDTMIAIRDSVDLSNIELIHHKIQPSWSLKNYIKNWLSVTRYCIENEEHPVFINNRLLFTDTLPINDEHIKQGVAFIKKNTISTQDRPYDNYSLDLLYIKKIRFVETIEKYFRENSLLFEEVDEDTTIDNLIVEDEAKNAVKVELANNKVISNEEIETIKKYQECWRNIPTLFADMDDGNIDITKYIDGSGYLLTQNFFAFENKWERSDLELIKLKSLKYKGTDIWGINISLHEAHPAISKLNSELTTIIINYRPMYMPLLNISWGDSTININVPEKHGLIHWSREEDTGFYNYIDSVLKKNNLLNPEVNKSPNEYFLFCNYILFDKPDVKYITNNMKTSFGVLFFDYNNKLLDAFSNIELMTKFLGYYSEYPDILESFQCPNDIEKTGIKKLNINDYNNEDEFKLYMEDLATFKYVEINKDTPKNKIATCLKLGVVPKILDDTKLLELEEITNSEEEWEILSAKCREYYTKNASLKSIGNKLIKHVFSM
jgi:hypothetical protein